MPGWVCAWVKAVCSVGVLVGLCACQQQNPAFIGVWQCAELELHLNGEGKFLWQAADGSSVRGDYKIRREGEVFRIDYSEAAWPVQAQRYIPSRYPVDGFYLSQDPGGVMAGKVVCQRKMVRGEGSLRSWLEEMQ